MKIDVYDTAWLKTKLHYQERIAKKHINAIWGAEERLSVLREWRFGWVVNCWMMLTVSIILL